MRNLAEVALDYLWHLEFSDDDDLDPDLAVKLQEHVFTQIESEFTEDEKQVLSQAAERRLEFWQREPDKHGYTPRKLLTVDQKAFLEALTAGRFDGYDFDDIEG